MIALLLVWGLLSLLLIPFYARCIKQAEQKNQSPIISAAEDILRRDKDD